MVKNCAVLKNNAAMTVIKFEDEIVQLPPINRDAFRLNVKFENGLYTAVDDDYKEPEVQVTEKPTAKEKKKKTTNEEKDFLVALELGEVE